MYHAGGATVNERDNLIYATGRSCGGLRLAPRPRLQYCMPYVYRMYIRASRYELPLNCTYRKGFLLSRTARVNLGISS